MRRVLRNLAGWSWRLRRSGAAHGAWVGPVRAELGGAGDRSGEPGSGMPRPRERSDREDQPAAVAGALEGLLTPFRRRGKGAVGEPVAVLLIGDGNGPPGARRVADGKADGRGAATGRGCLPAEAFSFS